jgi:L-aspartate oxidase
VIPTDQRAEMRRAMSRFVGVLRNAESLQAAAAALATVAATSITEPPTDGARDAWETTNLATVATAMVAAAATRTESRGCHRRTDFDEERPEWLTHLDAVLGEGGVAVTRRDATV